MGGSGQQIVKNTTNLAGWALRSFYDLARITSGQVDPREEPYRAMVLVAPDHIQTGSGRIDQRSTAEQQGAISGKYLVKKGEIIYSKIRPNLQKLALATEDCLCSADMYPVEARENISSVFLKYLMLSTPFTEFATSVSVRSGMPKINREELAYFSALVPEDLKEQQAIAEALSDADALIERLERLITKKRLIKQGAMQELLTRRRRLPGFSGEWKNFRLSEHGKFLSGSGFPLVYQGHSSGDYPFFKVSDFSGESNAVRLTHANHYIDSDIQRQLGARVFPPKAIVFAKIGAAIFLERKRMIAQASCLDNNMAAFVLQDAGLCVDLILAKFQFFALGDLVSSTALPAISSSDLKAIEFFLPKALDEQEAIAGVLNDMDAEIQALEDRLEKTQQIKEGMMQNLLTGRIRLV
ncbi:MULTISPECIES: restriction endonuclease subunit S [Gluconobacter]|uniref:Restriction endonuclease subunit S n=1 Tax=Gluconobacter cerinus TaxID=38307 RepID=A0A1B6VNM4_9PROT|nr:MULTISPECIES: restriction endonuclease subunit S [Gluconobacter]OAJ68803.1 restriction endonuclease subunit S [Gluconobacter cerinus]